LFTYDKLILYFSIQINKNQPKNIIKVYYTLVSKKRDNIMSLSECRESPEDFSALYFLWLFGICGGIVEHVNESLNRIIWWKTHIEKYLFAGA
jgi:hypothetical protein